LFGELVPRAERQRSRYERAATERKAMPGNQLAHPSPVPADREPVDGHGLERESHLRIIRDYVGEANPEGYIILYYRRVAVGVVSFFLFQCYLNAGKLVE